MLFAVFKKKLFFLQIKFWFEYVNDDAVYLLIIRAMTKTQIFKILKFRCQLSASLKDLHAKQFEDKKSALILLFIAY